jgi:hypothetical protein
VEEIRFLLSAIEALAQKKKKIELISVTLHRSQADLLLAYVYLQQGDGSGGEG